MNWLSKIFHRHASWWMLGITFAVYVLFAARILPNAEKAIDAAAGREVGIIDLGIGFDLEQINQQVEAYGPAGRALYRHTELTTDIVYPLTYAVFFTLIISLLMRGLPLSDRLKGANVLPFAMLGFDLLENTFLVSLLSAYPEQNQTLLWLTAIFRMLKWLVFAGVIGLILYLIGKRIFSRRERD